MNVERRANHLYRVCCIDGVTYKMLPETSLIEAAPYKKCIPLENRQTAARITVKQCHCKWHQAAEEATQKSTGEVKLAKLQIVI